MLCCKKEYVYECKYNKYLMKKSKFVLSAIETKKRKMCLNKIYFILVYVVKKKNNIKVLNNNSNIHTSEIISSTSRAIAKFLVKTKKAATTTLNNI